MQNLWQHYLSFWKQYVDVNSFSTRKDYWIPTIINSLLVVILVRLGKVGPLLACVFLLACAVPAICLYIRRMHDAGASAKLFWMTFIPIAGVFFQLMSFLIMFLPHGAYNAGFFAWNQRKLADIDVNYHLIWFWVVAGVMTAISIIVTFLEMAAIMTLLVTFML